MKKRTIIAIMILCALGLILGALTGMGDTVYLGIPALGTLQRTLGICTGIAALGCGALVIKDAADNSKPGEITAFNAVETEEYERIESSGGKLSVKGRMDAAAIQRMLEMKAQDEWSILAMDIEGCVTQMRQMVDYQDRLKKLLKNNAADTLYDTEEILDRVGQTICRNVRKVLNYMDVSDERDTHIIKEKIHECSRENEELLRKTQDFMYALTEFLNRQGDSGNEVDMLDVYKGAILDSIKGPA